MENSNRTELENQIINYMKKQPNERITFYQYMSMALYAPELGYYTKDKTKIGKEADFYTSSSVGPVFGQTIANSFVELFHYLENSRGYFVLEMGGGNGRFARDILNEFRENHPHIYSKLTYFMLETSKYHQNLQSEYLEEHLGHIVWINHLNELPPQFEGIIFSNELIDAFPVYKVKRVNKEIKEIYVTFNEQSGHFEEIVDDVSNPRLINYFIEQGITLKDGQVAEVNLDAIQWVEDISRILEKGYIITIDYGYTADELYASHRHEGSLMCYYRHVANDNPYQNIGEQDITVHVNFTILMDYAERFNIENVWFTSQSSFLLNNGILNYLTEIKLEESPEKDIFRDEALKKNRAIRQLITPGEMGETFKVLVQQKNVGAHHYRFLTNVWEQMGLKRY